MTDNLDEMDLAAYQEEKKDLSDKRDNILIGSLCVGLPAFALSGIFLAQVSNSYFDMRNRETASESAAIVNADHGRDLNGDGLGDMVLVNGAGEVSELYGFERPDGSIGYRPLRDQQDVSSSPDNLLISSPRQQFQLP